MASNNKVKIMYLNGSRFIQKEIDPGTTIGQFRADNDIPANATANVNTVDRGNDFVLENDHNLAFQLDNKNGGSI
tara:strand:- start:2676 stop:2900 length:225 start_codon:yes stop_codon:yes gene_type:complete